ncbi:DUF4184 family protein [Thorsellia anophelis]|uniref:Uncharacterized protein n=1 Tax=Thorsellia anophelis DSM 18579 TaxID=1123402 RepID=A0A1I0EFP2_9GAMM|nr:DUF4184 family protein [Thorsellia anophelis]SET43831.1 protein of unknown function [Thorsellia anophelis DSM 18579]
MPWTFSHPAAVIPIARICNGKVPAIGLVVGSCSPDFGYYLNTWDIATRSHSFVHSLYIALPICLILIAIFSTLRDGVLQLLPKIYSQVFEKFIPQIGIPKFRNLFFMVVAIVIGIYSHIIWDSFTHNPKYFRDWWPFIGYVFTVKGIEIPFFKILQHSSSVIGISLLLYWLIKTVNLHRKQQVNPLKSKSISWQVVYLFCIIIVCATLSILNYAYRFEIKISELHHFLFINAVQGGMLVFCFFLLSAAALQIKVVIDKVVGKTI